MCLDCCNWWKEWFKSFTKTEICLVIVVGVLLALCIAFMVFVIIHFMTCTARYGGKSLPMNVSSTFSPVFTTTDTVSTTFSTVPTTSYKSKSTSGNATTDGSDHTEIYIDSNSTTASDGIKCSWKPSEKTKEPTIYYKGHHTTQVKKLDNFTETTTKSNMEQIMDEVLGNLTDGEIAEEQYTKHVLALVKIKNSRDVTFGCILTIVSQHWVLTAASCVESIEEVDSLDAFIMVEGYGLQTLGPTHGVSDVQIHPEYQGVNRTHDLVALATEDNLIPGVQRTIQLPTLVDYSLITIGEKVTILGYGKFRSIVSRPTERRLNRFEVYWLPAAQCQQDAWALRHLWGGRAVSGGGCGVGSMACAGVLSARGSACQYCAGTPLMRANTLLGIMSDNKLCASACEPALYINIASVKDWIQSVIDGK